MDAPLGVRPKTTIDHDAVEFGSMRARTSSMHNPKRNATRTASIAAGRSSDSVAEQQIAAAAREPVQSPSTWASDGNGYSIPGLA